MHVWIMEDKHPLDFELGACLCKSFCFSDKKSGVHDWYVKEKLAFPSQSFSEQTVESMGKPQSFFIQ